VPRCRDCLSSYYAKKKSGIESDLSWDRYSGSVPQLLAVILGAASALALRLTANNLLGTINRRKKETLTVGTAARLAQADSSGIAR